MLAIAGAFSLLSAIAAVGIGRTGHPEPLPADAHELANAGADPSEPFGTA